MYNLLMNIIQKRVMILAVRAGELMMRHGSEVYRVEDTITRICNACGIPHVEVFATPTGVFVSLGSGGVDGEITTYIKPLRGRDTDLGKISRINSFSRIFTTTDLSVEDGIKELQHIEDAPVYKMPIRLLGAGIVSAFFCAIFSGSIVDSLMAFCIGITAYLVSFFLEKFDINYFIKGFCCCGVATVLALLLASSDVSDHYGAVIIGSMMIFVPGAAITNSIRDLLMGDMTSGMTRLMEAIVIAVSLAAGAGIVMKVWTFGGYFSLDDTLMKTISETSLPLMLALGFTPTMGFAIIYHAPKKCILPAALVGGIAWGLYEYISAVSDSAVAACFVGACGVGLCSDIFARILKEPSTIFIIPGLMPLVPGAYIYYTMVNLIVGDLTTAAQMGTETMFLAGAAAIGLLVTGSIIKIIISIKRKIYLKLN